MGYIEDLRAVVGYRPLILVGSAVLAINELGHLLLQQKLNGVWGVPGGIMELGESLEDTARREVYEETGLHVGQFALVGVFSGSEYFNSLPNGDEFYSVTVAYLTHEVHGESRADDVESLNVAFFPPDRLPPRLNRSKALIEQLVSGTLSAK